MKLTMTMVIALAMTQTVQTTNASELEFLLAKPADRAFVLDSSFDPPGLIGVLDPPYEPGDDQITVLGGMPGAASIVDSVPLGEGLRIMSLALSPDGRTMAVTRLFDLEVLLVRDFEDPASISIESIPMPAQPLALAFSPTGDRLAVGLQGVGPALVQMVEGVRDVPLAGELIELGVSSDVLYAVEAVAFDLSGRRALAQIALHNSPLPDPAFFVPQIVLTPLGVSGNEAQLGSPWFAPQESFIPPTPPFDDLKTGAPLGDFAWLCDGDRVIVPVSGALDIGQPDARILVLAGASTGELELLHTLTPLDGVGIAPFQIDLGADCDTAVVTNAFSADMTQIHGLDGPWQDWTLSAHPASSAFPAEPAFTPDQNALLVHHPRVPLDGVPPALVTGYAGTDLSPIGAPVGGPVRAWLQVKDSTLATWPASFVDRLRHSGLDWRQTRRVESLVHVAAWLADWKPKVAQNLMGQVGRTIERLAHQGRMRASSAQALLDLIDALKEVMGSE